MLLQAIDDLDADVLTIENSRSGNEMIVALAQYGYKKDVGPGVYDVHSPVVPRYGAPAAFANVWLPVLLSWTFLIQVQYLHFYVQDFGWSLVGI